jgi:hypothetical protein
MRGNRPAGSAGATSSFASSRAKGERPAAEFVLLAVIFGSVYAQSPLYSSNQNHHFLIGLARAGEGFLRDDWLAATVDPFPAFTWLVWLTHRYLHDWLFHAAYVALIGIYAYSLVRLVSHVVPAVTTATARLGLIAILAVIHNEVIAYFLLPGEEGVRWWQLTHWGVAEQEVFGHGVFQASAFGMLLFPSLLLFLRGRFVPAAALAALVGAVHPSYLLAAALLTLVYSGYAAAVDGRRPAAFLAAGVALVIVAPALLYIVWMLGPSSPETQGRAAAILANHIRQEARPESWMGWRALVQLGLMIGGILIARGSRLSAAMAGLLAAGLTLTMVQIATGSDTLALLFPWRLSVVLVPLATALIAGRVAGAAATTGQGTDRGRRMRLASMAVVIVCSASGLVRMAVHFGLFYQWPPIVRAVALAAPAATVDRFKDELAAEAVPALAFVKQTRASGDLYVVPPGLQRFRLETGVPVVADRKSHPYKDSEVLEWRARLDIVEAFYEGADCASLRSLTMMYRATHVLVERNQAPLACDGATPTFQDGHYVILRVGQPVPGDRALASSP